MAGTIYEWFGYRGQDASATAAQAAYNKDCPFLATSCAKRGKSGVCSILPTASALHVPVCPKRFYGDNYKFLSLIADDAFADLTLDRGTNGLPLLLPAKRARRAAALSQKNQVGVFGAGPWGGEISLPPAVVGAGVPSLRWRTPCRRRTEGKSRRPCSLNDPVLKRHPRHLKLPRLWSLSRRGTRGRLLLCHLFVLRGFRPGKGLRNGLRSSGRKSPVRSLRSRFSAVFPSGR